MSSHHTKKAINLHHDQVNKGKLRKMQRHIDRITLFLNKGERARLEYNLIRVLVFWGFVYMMAVTLVFLWYYNQLGIFTRFLH